jgi:hypothetical protein
MSIGKGRRRMPGNISTTRIVKALYYPYIHFQSLDWLKCALLFWEGVKRIVPSEDYYLRDSPEVTDLVAEGLIESVPATSYREAAAQVFRPKLEALANSRGGNYLVGTSGEFAVNATDKVGNVHIDKLDHRLAAELQRSGLGRQVGQSFQMGEAVAALYMIVLASQASKDLRAPMVTESPESEVSSLYFNTSGGSDKVTDDGLALARIVCPFPTPARVNKLPLQRVLEIRKKYRTERRNFRKQLQTIAEELKNVESPTALRDILVDYRSEIEDRLKTQRESLDEANVEAVWGAMSISAPTMIAAAAAATLLPPAAIPILGTTAVSIGVINWYAKVRGKRRAIREASPWHYLISLDKEIINRQAQDFDMRMSQLIYD